MEMIQNELPLEMLEERINLRGELTSFFEKKDYWNKVKSQQIANTLADAEMKKVILGIYKSLDSFEITSLMEK